jgi:hypothetical protein
MSEPGWPFGNRPKPKRLWALWKTGRLIEAETNEHPLGHELRVYVQGDFHYSHAHATRELAEAEADERKRELLAEGWTDRPPTPA